MFRPELYDRDDREVVAARDRATAALRSAVATLSDDRSGPDVRLDGLAAWSIVHGFAALWLGGALPTDLGADPETAGRPVIRRLFDQ